MTDFDRHITSSTYSNTGPVNDTIIQAARVRSVLFENTARLTGAGIDCVRMFRTPRTTSTMADWWLAVDPAPGTTVNGLVAAGWYSLLRMTLDHLKPALRLDVSPSAWLKGADVVALEHAGVVVFAAERGRADRLDDAKAAVIRAALACTTMSMLQILHWYDRQPIPAFGLTPAQLVAEGRIDAVMDHLSRSRGEGGGP
ncbi:MAG: hypothetical protein ACLGJC_00475 [Alphaproteobacteria bacterium]